MVAPGENFTGEIAAATALEPVTKPSEVFLGFTAMPPEIKEMYFLAKGSEQLVIPCWADPFDSVAMEVNATAFPPPTSI